MRRSLFALLAPLLLLGLAACGPDETPGEETATPTTDAETTETSPPVEVSDGGGELGDDDDEVVQPTETTHYEEQGEGTDGE
ncbi:hypothetical protein CFK39_01305 [Brachybacterium avium]|uniref:Uncharacterized protein n=1 Tax=Brachybacterium avium TaxID=2017485 RepID=A0A220U9Z6_9MICO|nr:hypothetical protein [Brachybacterium avium]ASK64701.1 hypothetical protein CFK39_01305 [Brachybacterium avium]